MGKINRYAQLSALLVGSAHIKYQHEVFDRWAADSGISSGVLRRRIQKPETIELGELRRMAEAVEVAPDQLIAVLPL